MKEKFLEELEAFCKASSVDLSEVSGKLLELVGEEEITCYHIVKGPLPGFPNTILDVFILTCQCLYNCEITPDGSFCTLLPLDCMTLISEELSEDKKFLSINFWAPAEMSLILQDRLENRKALQNFLKAVKENRLLVNSEGKKT